jgi:predicted nuclease of predicted toxin-antitoxin system
MNLLIDECAPRDLKVALSEQGFECRTVRELGLSGKKNGELLALAESRFDVLVTLDKSIQYQQNLTGRKIAILLIGARSNDMDDILPHLPASVAALKSIQPGQVVRVGWIKGETKGETKN